jgi:hypothetical protein
VYVSNSHLPIEQFWACPRNSHSPPSLHTATRVVFVLIGCFCSHIGKEMQTLYCFIVFKNPLTWSGLVCWPNFVLCPLSNNIDSTGLSCWPLPQGWDFLCPEWSPHTQFCMRSTTAWLILCSKLPLTSAAPSPMLSHITFLIMNLFILQNFYSLKWLCSFVFLLSAIQLPPRWECRSFLVHYSLLDLCSWPTLLAFYWHFAQSQVIALLKSSCSSASFSELSTHSLPCQVDNDFNPVARLFLLLNYIQVAPLLL